MPKHCGAVGSTPILVGRRSPSFGRLRMRFGLARGVNEEAFFEPSDGSDADSPEFGTSIHRSVAPFPAMILWRNFAMREIRVSDFFAELRLIT